MGIAILFLPAQQGPFNPGGRLHSKFGKRILSMATTVCRAAAVMMIFPGGRDGDPLNSKYLLCLPCRA